MADLKDCWKPSGISICILVTSLGIPFVTDVFSYTTTLPTKSVPPLLKALDTRATGVGKATGVLPFKVTLCIVKI